MSLGLERQCGQQGACLAHTGSGLDPWQLGVVVHTFNQELGRQTQEDQAGELDHQVKVLVSHA